ncbi:MAG TPA: fumarylacetoacetate hydrolase family protein [Pseudolabrys sp.]|nr:fumarylacetoacetate hydrolase family protein [Pseudolabrys sp.]
MRLISFATGTKESYGALTQDGVIDLGARVGERWPTLRAAIAASALDTLRELVGKHAPDHALAAIRFRPVLPDADKVMCVGKNYRDHAEETGSELPENPRVFLKHRSAIVAHEEPVVRPKVSKHFDYEGELTVVIGRAGRHIAPERAPEHVAGYTLLNDGSVRDYQQHSLFAGKNFERTSGFGPCMTTADEIPDPRRLTLMTRLNGTEVQRSGVDKLLYDIPFLISYLSRVTMLTPGDCIATGTPAGVGSRRNPPLWMKPGDTIEVEVAEIGVLRNPVIAED